MRKLLLVAAVFISFRSSAQCLLIEVPLQQRISSSDLIVEGRVIATHSFWNDNQNMIYTSNRVEVYKIFKGNITGDYIDVLTTGGIVDDRMIKADPALSLNENETGIFTCETVKHFKALPAATAGIPRYEAFADMQGFIKYDLQQGTAADPFKQYNNIESDLYNVLSPAHNFIEKKHFDIHAVPVPAKTDAISSFSPTTITAGTGSVLTINGSGFGATQGAGTVGFKNADDGGATYINPLPSEYVSWSDTKIDVRVPQNAGTGTIQVTQGATSTSGTSLTVSYAHLNVDFDPGSGTVAYQTDHVNDNGTGGYTWRMNIGFDANALASASFMRAFNNWRCTTGINWTIGATTAINDAVSDGTNIICFDNTAPLPSGVLGTCYSYWSGCASGPNIVWYVNELDIIFDDGSNIAPLTWDYGPGLPTGSQYDFETVTVHELGHGHQLGHVINPGAIMHYAISNGASNRSLSANDIAGGNYVQAKSVVANICGPGAMTAYSCVALPLAITSVKAYQKNNGIEIAWKNSAESGVQHYEVEKSGDGIHFISASSIGAKANNDQPADYTWYDGQVFPLNNYYRIKTTGFSGEIKYSAIVNVKFSNNTDVFSVYPNPVKGSSVTIELNAAKGVYSLKMFNATGQQVMNRSITHNGGVASENITLPDVAAGVYSMLLQGDGLKIQQRVVIDK